MASNVTRDHHRWTRDITAKAGDVNITLKDAVSSTLNIFSEGAASPILQLKGINQASSASPALQFLTARDTDTAGQVGDVLGIFNFIGYHNGAISGTPGIHTFGHIKSEIDVVIEDQESGKLSLQVASHDGGLENGLVLTGGSVDAEVDVTIGNGAASVTTIAGNLDIDGGKITSAGALEIDPGGALSITGAHVAIDTTQKISFDSGGDTYIAETSADILDFYVGGIKLLTLIEAGGGASDKVAIPPATPLYLDGGGDTAIIEVGADLLGIKVGGDYLLTLSEYGDDGNEVLFKTSCATFTRSEAIFSTTGIIGSGGTDDTDIDFRFSNKFRLEMTGDITTINLIFPKGSGNFLLVCTTDGDHDVTNWKVWEYDESAATTADVMWAGGSVPAFTSSGVDIVSFYWDSIEQQCYGTASLAFATP